MLSLKQAKPIDAKLKQKGASQVLTHSTTTTSGGCRSQFLFAFDSCSLLEFLM